MLSIRRGGLYLRVASPEWKNPLDPSHARRRGGRWNPPGAFGVVYLCADERVARANVLPVSAGLPYGPDDLVPDEGPQLVSTAVPDDDYVDIVTDSGCLAASLPRTYPTDADGATVPWETCQPIGQAAWEGGAPGGACRSAAPGAPPDGEELAFFDRGARLKVVKRRAFGEWF